MFRWTLCPESKTVNVSEFLFHTQFPLSLFWLWLVFRETNRLIFPAVSGGRYWYGPGDLCMSLLLNNATSFSHSHNTWMQTHQECMKVIYLQYTYIQQVTRSKISFSFTQHVICLCPYPDALITLEHGKSGLRPHDLLHAPRKWLFPPISLTD